MNLNESKNCERTKLEQFLNKVQLPHWYKKIGVVILILSFITLLILKFINDVPLWFGIGLKHLMLIALLLISLSREKVEDEMIETLRSKSYALAFIIGVGYSLLQTIANYFVDLFLGRYDFSNDLGHIQVLLFMLLIQVGFFELLKRTR